MSIGDILGAIMQTGISRSSSRRLQHALGAGSRGTMSGLTDIFGGAGESDGRGQSLSQMLAGNSGLGVVLGSLLGDAGQAVGGKRNLALYGLGALAGALLGGRERQMQGAVGGGVMALIGAVAFSALKKAGYSKPVVPLGLRAPQTTEEKIEMEKQTILVFRAMINAGKADGQIDPEETQRLLGKLQEMGVGSDNLEYVRTEMNLPMDTESIVLAASGRPELAANLYAASLLAIEVDTVAEKEYMRELAGMLGLDPVVIEHLEKAVGMR